MITQLTIETILRNNKTILVDSFATSPLKIANITENKQAALLELMLMSSSPGILNGDEYQLKISVGSHCSLRLKTQSFQRLFNMHEGIDTKGATQKFEIIVADNAFFCYIPHPMVPHKHAIFSNANSIKLHPTSKLIWGEIISCGRKLNGEIFHFTRLKIKTEIFVAGKLVIKENLLAEPAKTPLSSIGQWEGYSHQASLFIVDDCQDLGILKELLLTFLQQQKCIEFGISELHIKGLIIRLLGYKGEQLYTCLQQIADLVMIKMEQKTEPHVT